MTFFPFNRRSHTCLYIIVMKIKRCVMKISTRLFSCFILLMPFLAFSQVTPAKDSAVKTGLTDSLAIHDSTHLVKKDTVVVETEKAVKLNCYSEWLDAFRTRGAKSVPDGMQEVVIALKD